MNPYNIIILVTTPDSSEASEARRGGRGEAKKRVQGYLKTICVDRFGSMHAHPWMGPSRNLAISHKAN